MAELDAHTAKVLCSALEPFLGQELGHPVTCFDVSSARHRWDLEARDALGNVLRRVSHVRALSEASVQAEAEVCQDVWPSIDAELKARGVTDCGVAFGVRSLPTSQSKRRALARELAARIHAHLARGAAILEDITKCLMAGRDPFDDPVTAAFYDVEVIPMPGTGPARVRLASSDRLSFCVPPLADVVLPVVARKQERHGALASTLTLVVQLFDRGWTDEDLAGIRRGLKPRHRGFKSAYIARCPVSGAAQVDHLY